MQEGQPVLSTSLTKCETVNGSVYLSVCVFFHFCLIVYLFMYLLIDVTVLELPLGDDHDNVLYNTGEFELLEFHYHTRVLETG